MNLSFDVVVQRIQRSKIYTRLFKKVYKEVQSKENITNALAAFQRDLESDGNAPHDIWIAEIDLNALSTDQLRGREIFLGDQFNVLSVILVPTLLEEFRNIRFYDGVELVDKGRLDITKDSNDLGRFKAPVLRNVELTALYMHNGMFSKLEEVIDFYSDPYEFVDSSINLDALMIKPLNFKVEQKQYLVNFLKSLTVENIPNRDK